MNRHISDLPERLKHARLQKHLSQKELAELVGVNPSMISSYESGLRSPSLVILAKLSVALSVSTDTLLGLTDENTTTTALDISSLTLEQQYALQILLDAMNSKK